MAKQGAFEQGLVIGLSMVKSITPDDLANSNTLKGFFIANGSRGVWPLKLVDGFWKSVPAPTSATYTALNGTPLDTITLRLSSNDLKKSVNTNSDLYMQTYTRRGDASCLTSQFSVDIQ